MLDLGNIKKWVNNLIKPSLGGVSINDFWVLEISCILAPPPSFVTRTHPMLQKLTIPLTEDCVLVLHILPQHPVSIPSLVTLLMSGHTAHQPLYNSNASSMLLLTLLYRCQLWIYIVTPSHLLLLQLQPLQLRSIQNTELSMFSMMNMSPKS